jgi:hypothetical protein
MREAEPTLRDIQLRGRDAEIEEDPGEVVSGEPGAGNVGQIFESCVTDGETRVIPEASSSVSQRFRVFIQGE